MEEKLKQQPSNHLKFVLFGPESTGKTTLTKALADHFGAAWVPEYLRTFAQQKHDRQGGVISEDEIMQIAKGQMALENDIRNPNTELLFCDTNLLEILVYATYYFPNFTAPQLEEAVSRNYYDHYFLTYIDTPWVADNLRDRPHDREEMFRTFEGELRRRNLPYTVLKGPFPVRLQTAIASVEKLYKTKR